MIRTARWCRAVRATIPPNSNERPYTRIPTRTVKLLALAAVCIIAVAPASAQVTFYENDDFQGLSYSTRGAVSNFLDRGFNDRASSIVVTSQRWEVCEGAAQQRCWMEKQDVVVE